MEMKLTLVFLLAVACGGAGALKCYSCTTLLSANPDCEKSPPDSRFLTDCPAPTTGYVTRCILADGTLTVTAAESIDIEDFERGCANYLSSNVPENKCYKDDDGLAWALEALPPDIRPTSGTVTFDGSICFCDTDGCNGVTVGNGVTTIQPFGLMVVALGMFQIMLWY